MCGNHVLFEEFRVNLHTKKQFQLLFPMRMWYSAMQVEG